MTRWFICVTHTNQWLSRNLEGSTAQCRSIRVWGDRQPHRDGPNCAYPYPHGRYRVRITAPSKSVLLKAQGEPAKPGYLIKLRKTRAPKMP